jgi:hypothetical protein
MLTSAIKATAILFVAAATYAGSEVAVFLQPRDYLAPQYMKKPGGDADYVYVVGERIRINVELWNRGERPVRVDTSRAAQAGLVRLVLLRKEAGGYVEVPSSVAREGEPSLRTPVQTLPGTWGDVLELPFKGSLAIPLEIDSDALATPGIYLLRVSQIPLTCEGDCQIKNQAGEYRFEIRSASAVSEQIESLTRRAYHAIERSRVAEAEAAIAQLLKVHPSSVVARQFEGDLAESQRQWARAEAAYASALRILERGDDRLLAEPRDHGDGRRRYLSDRQKAARASGRRQ